MFGNGESVCERKLPLHYGASARGDPVCQGRQSNIRYPDPGVLTTVPHFFDYLDCYECKEEEEVY
jgi:hypothetical protein